MHMAFLSRGFKNLQWYSMTKNALTFVSAFPFFTCHRSPSFLSVSLRTSARRSLRYSEKATLSSP